MKSERAFDVKEPMHGIALRSAYAAGHEYERAGRKTFFAGTDFGGYAFVIDSLGDLDCFEKTAARTVEAKRLIPIVVDEFLVVAGPVTFDHCPEIGSIAFDNRAGQTGKTTIAWRGSELGG